MITFSSVKDTSKKKLEIPKEVSSKFIYYMFCNDEIVGTTYGNTCKRLIVKMSDGTCYRFDTDLIKKIQKRNITIDQLLKFGTII